MAALIYERKKNDFKLIIHKVNFIG